MINRLITGQPVRSLPVAEWPLPDQAAWAIAQAPLDQLEVSVGLANRWAPTTRALIERGYGRWLGWLHHTDQLDVAEGPGARASQDRVRDYMNGLQVMEYAPYTVSGYIQQLGDALRAMAPEADWGWILRAANRLHQQAHSIKDLNDRMQPPEALLQLGFDLLDHAEHDRFRTDYDRAVMFRDGLALAALIQRPLRIGNFAKIAIGGQLRRCGEGWRLVFSAAEMKARRPFECFWPDELDAPLERYLNQHRNVLFEGKRDPEDVDALWIAKGGNGMTRSVLAYRIIKRTEDEFGTAINPHTFRHIAATAIATEDPENVTAVPAVLAHATLETSERYYNRAKQVDAAGRYQDVVNARRRERAVRKV